jgi:hypothetical protein
MDDNSGAPAKLQGLAFGAGCLIGIVIHIWTVILAYQFKGFWPMVMTLVLPGISEFYWAYTLWGTMTYYSVIAVVCVALSGILRGIGNALGS